MGDHHHNQEKGFYSHHSSYPCGSYGAYPSHCPPQGYPPQGYSHNYYGYPPPAGYPPAGYPPHHGGHPSGKLYLITTI